MDFFGRIEREREREIEKGHRKKLDESDYLGLFG